MRLTLYTRRGCHLCDDMLIELELLGQRQTLHVDVVDVDRDPALQARYGAAVPVLMQAGTELCRGHLNRDALDKITKN